MDFKVSTLGKFADVKWYQFCAKLFHEFFCGEDRNLGHLEAIKTGRENQDAAGSHFQNYEDIVLPFTLSLWKHLLSSFRDPFICLPIGLKSASIYNFKYVSHCLIISKQAIITWYFLTQNSPFSSKNESNHFKMILGTREFFLQKQGVLQAWLRVMLGNEMSLPCARRRGNKGSAEETGYPLSSSQGC